MKSIYYLRSSFSFTIDKSKVRNENFQFNLLLTLSSLLIFSIDPPPVPLHPPPLRTRHTPALLLTLDGKKRKKMKKDRKVKFACREREREREREMFQFNHPTNSRAIGFFSRTNEVWLHGISNLRNCFHFFHTECVFQVFQLGYYISPCKAQPISISNHFQCIITLYLQLLVLASNCKLNFLRKMKIGRRHFQFSNFNLKFDEQWNTKKC